MMQFLKLYLILIAIIYGCSCSNPVKTHKCLISSSCSFISEFGEETEKYYQNRDEYIKPYQSVVYQDYTIKASTLHSVNCGGAIGNIEIEEDTIFLLFDYLNKRVACTSEDLYQFDYVIYNPEKKKYIVRF